MKVKSIWVARIEIDIKNGEITYQPYAHKTIMHGKEIFYSETNHHLMSANADQIFDNEIDALKKANEMIAGWGKREFQSVEKFMRKNYSHLLKKAVSNE
jgi:hypothetical protein